MGRLSTDGKPIVAIQIENGPAKGEFRTGLNKG